MILTTEELVIAIARIAGSLPVLRWAFVGAIIAILVDFSDLFMKNLLDLGGLRDYQSFDKWVDLVYMVTFLIVALRWSGIERRVAIGLFAYRIVGDVVFEIVAWRGVLLFFPNVFEFWFVFVAGRNLFKPAYVLTIRRTVYWLFVLLLLKEAQEYILHWWQVLDRYTAVEIAESWWNVIKGWF